MSSVQVLGGDFGQKIPEYVVAVWAARCLPRHRRLDRGPPPFRRANSRFVVDSALEGAVYCELVSEVQKLGADSGRVMDDSGIVKRCFPHEFGRKLYPLPEGSPRPPAISRCDYVRFPATAASPTVNLPSIKGAGPTTPRHDRAKTSFCSATYGPKWHPAIYRDISALVHY